MSPLKKLLHRVASNPRVFDWIQRSLGLEHTHRRLTPYLSRTDKQVVLDIGAGTGNFSTLIPESATHLALDIDLKRLRALKAKHPSSAVIVCDATAICLRQKSVDHAVCIALAHHLSDAQLPLLFSELARVTKQRLVFLDPVECNDSQISSLLWKYDRGSYPRLAEALCAAIEPWFQTERIERYAIFHRYLMFVGRPRPRT